MKVFLSHSSADKDSYVRIVADTIGVEYCVYDEYTFEEGMKSLDEILIGLTKSQLFVIFISDTALSSEWVKIELTEAKNLLNSGSIKKVFPIIIDKNITYSDNRIPKWMRDEYNLKYVSQPTVAARRIQQRMRELSWESHPNIAQREKIFVGRNAQIKEFEERLDDFELPQPVCVIASGMKEIGRRSFMRHALVKTSVASESYKPTTIDMARHESLEDFIIKLSYLSLSEKRDLTGMLGISVEQKVDLAVEIITEIQQTKEIIFVLDDGCIVNYKREVEGWFTKIIDRLTPNPITTFGIAAYYRPAPNKLRRYPSIFALDLRELTVKERQGLLKRYLEVEKIMLSTEDFSFFADLMYGYPKQVLFAVDMIKDLGLRGAKKESHQIQEYNAEKASIIMQRYHDNEEVTDVLRLLSEFEFISLGFLFDIIDEAQFSPVIEDLVARSICDFIGIEQEFIRLNDAIRDYIRRIRLGLPDKYKDKLEKHVTDYVNSNSKEDKDLSDYIFSTKFAMINGKKIDEKYLIPSHFIRTMRDLYQVHKHYERVTELADMILQKESSLEDTIKEDIRYFLCLSLARKRDPRLLKEVQKIRGAEHNFLLGFYYRLTRRYREALEKLTVALSDPVTATRAKSEIVQVYMNIEEYDKAYSLASESYNDKPDNLFHIYSFFKCIIYGENVISNKALLEKLLLEISRINTDQATEMSMTAKALYSAKIDDDYDAAINTIDDAIHIFNTSPYPLITKFDICLRVKDLVSCDKIIKQMEKESAKRGIYSDAITRAKAFHLAASGDIGNAINVINSELKNYPASAKEKILAKINHFR